MAGFDHLSRGFGRKPVMRGRSKVEQSPWAEILRYTGTFHGPATLQDQNTGAEQGDAPEV